MKIDARGKACPLPVIEAKNTLKTMENSQTLLVIVDNFIAVQNLQKMSEQLKFKCDYNTIDKSHYEVSIHKTDDITKNTQEIVYEDCTIEELSNTRKNTIVVIDSDTMGNGDEKLGKALMKAFIYSVTELDTLPSQVIMYNRGAFLSTTNKDTVADLKLLNEKGVEIKTCGTCLNFYGLEEDLKIGVATNMYDIVQSMNDATNIIKP